MLHYLKLLSILPASEATGDGILGRSEDLDVSHLPDPASEKNGENTSQALTFIVRSGVAISERARLPG